MIENITDHPLLFVSIVNILCLIALIVALWNANDNNDNDTPYGI